MQDENPTDDHHYFQPHHAKQLSLGLSSQGAHTLELPLLLQVQSCQPEMSAAAKTRTTSFAETHVINVVVVFEPFQWTQQKKFFDYCIVSALHI